MMDIVQELTPRMKRVSKYHYSSLWVHLQIMLFLVVSLSFEMKRDGTNGEAIVQQGGMRYLQEHYKTI
jgi:hypothetical protein